MWQIAITGFIVALALFFIGKKVYHTFRQAMDPEQDISCGGCCGNCTISQCDSRKKQ